MSEGLKKVGGENVSGEEGSLNEGRDNADVRPEHQSDGVNQKPLRELYPKNPGESWKAYDKRIKRIRKKLGKTANLPYPGPERKSPEERERELAANFETFTASAVSDMAAAKDPKSPKHIMNISELKRTRKLNRGNVEDEVVNYYVGPNGVFTGYGDEDYSDDERAFVANRKADFARKDQQNSDIAAIQREGKKFESLFYAMVESGVFGKDAAYVVASEHDDDKNKTDVAIVIQDDQLGPQPICFDLTTSKLSDSSEGDGKLWSIKKGIDKNHGIVRPSHLYTCLGKELPYLEQGIPHFVLCLPWNRKGGEPEFFEAKEALTGGKSVPREIQALMNMQIFLQAARWGKYYHESEQKDSGEKAKLFNGLAIYFRGRFLDSLGVGVGETAKAINAMFNRHPDATRFISKFFLSNKMA